MKFKHISILSAVAVLAIISFQCKKEEVIQTPPVADFRITPGNGVTTTVFQFNATTSKTTNPGDTILFLRWDWDNDGLWDTGFSRSRQFTYRYYKPGTYSPKLEVRNEGGLSDTIQYTVQVARGNSAPQPSLSISPASGNLRTEFTFDGSKTIDDEDSLNTLKFRWDWDGDGIYETNYSSEYVYTRMFNSAGLHYVGMQVVDPQNVTATIRKPILVSLSNPKLVPEFSWMPESPSTSDTVKLDGSASYDPDDASNTFQYRWNLGKDSDFDTEYSDSPIFNHQFLTEGENTVTLEIKDQWGLLNQVTKTIWIAHSNLKPTASFFVGYEYGNLTTSFYFDADGIRDQEDYIDQLKVRWDFENDGTWDTGFAKERNITHKYPAAGEYRIRLQVIDSGGLTDTTSLMVYVSAGTNETGLIMDKAKGIYYGTVKIGSQWWTSENVNEASASKYCYSNKVVNCQKYGALYTWTDAMGNAITEKAKGICPTGWHIPTVAEWQQLYDFYGNENARARLEIGGDSDFRLMYAGQRSLNGRYEYQEAVTSFWTSTKASGDNAWVFSIQKDKNNVFKLNLGQTYGLSVRCIKD